MVEALAHPLNIFILGLGGGFAIPLLHRMGNAWLTAGFFIALSGIAAVSCIAYAGLLQGGLPVEILTAGAEPPLSINLRFGQWEGFFTSSVNIVSLLGALYLWDRLRGNYAALLLYLILVMGINGMVMTRDLFNLFVFLEIVSIATYGLFALDRSPSALAAAFKYIMATVIASTFFLLGSVLIYHVAGTLNIDELIAMRSQITGPIGTTALLLLLACLMIELKPFPANGWGLDVYETMPSGIAAMVSVGVSAGVFFALFKLLPLFEAYLGLVAIAGGITFLASNLIGIVQTNVQRMLGYSSIAQMGLSILALALLQQQGALSVMPLIIGGLFINHLLAKAGLFWLAGLLRGDQPLPASPMIVAVFALLIVAISGLPPFPGFFAKWELVMQLADAGRFGWIALLLAGSLLESVYMFRWFFRMTDQARAVTASAYFAWIPVLTAAVLLCAAGAVAAALSNVSSAWMVLPLAAGLLLFALDGLPTRIKGLVMLVVTLGAGTWFMIGSHGIAGLFAPLLLAGSLVIAAAGLSRSDARLGHYPLMAILILSIMALLRATTSLEFFVYWEMITLSSCFLIARVHGAGSAALPYLLFSLVAAFLMLTGFATIAAVEGSRELAILAQAGPASATALVLLGAGLLIKSGVIGFHVWLPLAYAEADDDVTAMLSAVVSKVAMFGLLAGTYLAIRSDIGLDLAHLMAWLGLLTTCIGALLALRQMEVKRLLAYSSMSQIGYIITAVALMSHLGWVTALYLVANHLLVKGVLFLALAGIILRLGARRFDELGGLARTMPLTSAMVLVAVLAMSGLPPLMGFGGKWLLLHAMIGKGWYGLAIAALLATFLGFLYMIRLVAGLLFGPARPMRVSEAPLTLLLPQFLLVIGLLVLSFFPKLLMGPVSAAIDPYFAAGLVWEGMQLEAIYDYWNPAPTMLAAVVTAAALMSLLWLGRRKGEGAAGFLAFRPVGQGLPVPPLATSFWNGISQGSLAAGQTLRLVYTGNGQTYALYVFHYFLVLYFLSWWKP